MAEARCKHSQLVTRGGGGGVERGGGGAMKGKEGVEGDERGWKRESRGVWSREAREWVE